MILNRIGNKSKIADKIIARFPPHDLFIDMFFGAGGLFFKKPLAKYNVCNDLMTTFLIFGKWYGMIGKLFFGSLKEPRSLKA